MRLTMVNTDELAEMHYAKYDPAYETEDDLMEQKELIESRAIKVFETTVKNVLMVLDDAELKALADNRDALADWVCELLEDYE
jgi:hypothetical protein